MYKYYNILIKFIRINLTMNNYGSLRINRFNR